MAANNLLIEKSNVECHNCDGSLDSVEGTCQDYYYAICGRQAAAHNSCLSLASQLLACTERDQYSSSRCPVEGLVPGAQVVLPMDPYNKQTHKTLTCIWQIQNTIVVTLMAFAVARVVRHKLLSGSGGSRLLWFPQVFGIEFAVISLPVVISVNVLNPYVEYIVALATLLFAAYIWRSKCLQRAAQREFEFGRRPAILTLMRCTINILTALCILAIDFESFPKKFRKSRRFGAGLMDVGIGLFVSSMAFVSPRLKRLSELRTLAFTVGCMLTLGFVRTLIITTIDYHQDEHEYGVHLNAFFTLGLTKLFATLVGYVARSEMHLLPLGLAILIGHELALQLGLSDYVMDPNLERTNLFNSNREGFCSLPGFIALYLLSQFFGQWLKAKDILNFKEIMKKLAHLFIVAVLLWLIVVASAWYLGIARVTCSLGYVAWIMAIVVSMCFLFLFVFDIFLDTMYPKTIEDHQLIAVNGMAEAQEGLTPSKPSNDCVSLQKLPIMIEAVNYNGLMYFLLANILTGAVNIYLNTPERNDAESVLILIGYMFVTTIIISLLYRYRIRIA